MLFLAITLQATGTARGAEDMYTIKHKLIQFN